MCESFLGSVSDSTITLVDLAVFGFGNATGRPFSYASEIGFVAQDLLSGHGIVGGGGAILEMMACLAAWIPFLALVNPEVVETCGFFAGVLAVALFSAASGWRTKKKQCQDLSSGWYKMKRGWR